MLHRLTEKHKSTVPYCVLRTLYTQSAIRAVNHEEQQTSGAEGTGMLNSLPKLLPQIMPQHTMFCSNFLSFEIETVILVDVF